MTVGMFSAVFMTVLLNPYMPALLIPFVAALLIPFVDVVLISFIAALLIPFIATLLIPFIAALLIPFIAALLIPHMAACSSAVVVVPANGSPALSVDHNAVLLSNTSAASKHPSHQALSCCGNRAVSIARSVCALSSHCINGNCCVCMGAGHAISSPSA
jgi:hypothetical protein